MWIAVLHQFSPYYLQLEYTYIVTNPDIFTLQVSNWQQHKQLQQIKNRLNSVDITETGAKNMDMKSPLIASRQPLSSMTSNNLPECAGCHKVIRERYLLKALDQLWHEDCLKCACCDCRLGEVGSTLFTKANLILCK